MKRFIKFISAFVSSALLLLSGTCGCAVLERNPPFVSEVQAIFERDKESLLLVTDYFINAGYTDLYINDDCETALADLDKIHINDAATISAFKQLRSKGYEFFSKKGNTISFGIWSRFRDVGCGIAYSIDGAEISVEYMAESAPLSEDGWYYYVDDFNEWRAQNDS